MKLVNRLIKLAAVCAVFVGCLVLLVGAASATPTVTISTGPNFNGVIFGTAPAGSDVDWKITSPYSSYATGTVTADVTGHWAVDVRTRAIWVNHQDGYAYTFQAAPGGTTTWVTATLTVDVTIGSFTYQSGSSGTVTNEDVPFTINAAFTGYVVLTYETKQAGTLTSSADGYTSQHIAVTSTGVQTLRWRPGTPPGSSVIYNVISVTAYDSAGNAIDFDNTGFTFTHHPAADYTLSFSGPDVASGGVIYNDGGQPHIVTVTLMHGSTPVSGVTINQDGNPIGTTDANGRVPSFTVYTPSMGSTQTSSQFTATVNGNPVSAYLAFPLIGSYAVDMTVVDTDGTPMTGNVYDPSHGLVGTVGPNAPPLVLHSNQTALYVQAMGKQHKFFLRADPISPAVRLSIILYGNDPNLGHLTVNSPLPSNTYSLNQSGTPWKYSYTLGPTGNLDIMLEQGKWDVVDSGEDAAHQPYILIQGAVDVSPATPATVTLDATPANLATVQARTQPPGWVDQSVGTMQIGITPSGAVSSTSFGTSYQNIYVTPGRYGVFQAALADTETYVGTKVAYFVPSWVADGVADLQAGQPSPYQVDASGTGDLALEGWGHGSLQSGSDDTFHGRLMYQGTTGKFYPMPAMITYSFSATGALWGDHPSVTEFGGWFTMQTPAGGDYTITVSHGQGGFFRDGARSLTATVTTFWSTLMVDGAFDGRGIGRNYVITGRLADGIFARTVQYTVGQGAEVRTAAVDPSGRFTLRGTVSGVTGEWVPVTVQIPGDPSTTVSFTAVIDDDHPDLLQTPTSSATPLTAIVVASPTTDPTPFNLKGIHLEYTADVSSSTPRWTVGQVRNQMGDPSIGTWGGETRPEQMTTAGWTVPQGGPSQYKVRYAAEDWAGNLGPWHTLTVDVAPVTVTVSAGGQPGAPVQTGLFRYVTVNVKVGGVNQPGYSVYANDLSVTTDVNGNAVFPIYSETSQVLPVEVYRNPLDPLNDLYDPNDLIATTAIFVMAPDQAGVVFAATDSNGPVHDLNVGYRDAAGTQTGRLWGDEKVYAIVPAGTYRTSISAPAFNGMRYALFEEDTVPASQVTTVNIDAATGAQPLSTSWQITDSVDPTNVISDLVLKIRPDDTSTRFEDAMAYPSDTVLVKSWTSAMVAAYYGMDTNGDHVVLVKQPMTGRGTSSYSATLQTLAKVTNDSQNQRAQSGDFAMDLTLGQAPYQIEADLEPGRSVYIAGGTYSYRYTLSQIVYGDGISGYYTAQQLSFTAGSPLTATLGTTSHLVGGGPLTGSINLLTPSVAGGGQATITLGAQNAAGDVLTSAVAQDYVGGIPYDTTPLGATIAAKVPDMGITFGEVAVGSPQSVSLPPLLPPGTYGLEATFDLGEYTPPDFTLTAGYPSLQVTSPGFALVPVFTPDGGYETADGKLVPGGSFRLSVVYQPVTSNPNLSLPDTDPIVGSIAIDPNLFTVVPGSSAISYLSNTVVTYNPVTHTVDFQADPASGTEWLYAGDTLMEIELQVAPTAPATISFAVDPSQLTMHATTGTQSFNLPYLHPTVTFTPLQTYVYGDTEDPSGQSVLSAVFGVGATPSGTAQAVSTEGYELQDLPAGTISLLAARAGYLPQTATPVVTVGQTGTQTLTLLYGDINGDGQITAADLDVMTQHLHQTAPSLPVDGNGDHSTDLQDLVLAAQNYGASDSPAAYGSLTVTVSYSGATGDSPLSPYVALYVPDTGGADPALRIPVAVRPATAAVGNTFTFNFPRVPAGSYDVEFATPGYDPGRVSNVSVAAGGSAAVTITTKPAMTVRVIGARQNDQYGVVAVGGSLSSQVVSSPWSNFDNTAYSDAGSLSSSPYVEYTWDGADTETFLVSQLTPDAVYNIGVQARYYDDTVADGTVIEVSVGRNVQKMTVNAGTESTDEWLAFIVTVDNHGVVTITPDGTPNQFSPHAIFGE